MADVYTDPAEDKTEDGGGQKETEASQAKDSSSFHGVIPPNPFGPRHMLKSDVVSKSSHSTFNTHPVYIAPSRLGSSSVFSKSQTSSSTENKGSGPQKSSILAPSKLDMLNQTETSSPSKLLLRPSPLSFCVQNLKQKECDVKDKEKENQEKSGSEDVPSEVSKVSSDSGVKRDAEKKKDNDKETAPLSDSSATNDSAQENYFAAALAKSDGKESESSSKTEEKSGQFIFGQNLDERVTGVAKSPNEKTEEGFVFGQNLEERVIKTDPSSGEQEESEGSRDCLSPTDKNLTLEESAREFQARKEKHVDYKEVDVVTGEEGESNVLQATAKLFVFESHGQNWVERGRGLLRLNDLITPSPTEFQSRLVMRTIGSLRVILNTKIWPGMTIERASNRSVRITATDGGEGVKVFLIMTSPKDSENILRAVDWRIQQLRVREDVDKPQTEKRKVDQDESSNEGTAKKPRSEEHVEGSLVTGSLKREESDGSVIGPETDASSTSSTSSLTLRSESD
ncbi:ran-binding protein 3-like isoform X1 [Saccostrea cucullata]|uniref:ran-binding protein 3-like isoform X1 n=1 Tax=Saccostrea cuccullata TaxID=36930 RepID=UPI002ED2B014